MIDRVDHLVLTVADLGRTIDFYVRGLGMKLETFGQGRKALAFGRNKINLHVATDAPIVPRADRPTPGSADFCLIAHVPLAEVIARLNSENIPIEVGPVDRTGATGAIRSIYVRDPDRNLLEISVYENDPA